MTLVIALIMALVFPIVANAAPAVGYVNIKDPMFGAVGNGVHDDTRNIQAAIDYAFNHHLDGVYCPAGTYQLATKDANNVYLYLDPPGGLRTHPTGSPLSQFSMTFFGDPASGGVHLAGCILRTTDNNAMGLIVGTGNSMRVSDIGVVGPNLYAGHNGDLPTGGVGIGIGCSGGGATGTLIENTYVRYFYAAYKTCALGYDSLSDSNTWRKVFATDSYIGLYLNGTQSFINDVIEPTFYNNAIDILNPLDHQVNVIGGNLSTNYSQSAHLTVSGATASNCAGGQTLCLTATVTNSDGGAGSPDPYISNVYNSFTILTPHYGLIPFNMTGYNTTTHVIQLRALDSWENTNYGPYSYWSNNNIYTELNASTLVFAAERVRVAQGQGISMNGVHVENDRACTTLFDGVSNWTGQTSNSFTDMFYDYQPQLPNSAVSSNAWALIYCQQAFPWINDAIGGPIRLIGGNWTIALPPYDPQPFLLDLSSNSTISGQQLGWTNGGGSGPRQYPRFNIRFPDPETFGEIAQPNFGGTNSNQIATVTRATGNWDADYFLPLKTYFAFGTNNLGGAAQINGGELMSPYCGDEPCPSEVPNLSPTMFSLVCPTPTAGSPNTFGSVAYTCPGALGTFGTYPPIPSRTVFKSLDWNTGAPNKLFLHSGHGSTIPGWSWGKSISQANWSASPTGTFHGFINGTQLCVTATDSGTVNAGGFITGAGVSANTIILGVDSYPSACSAGTPFKVSVSQTVGSAGTPVAFTSPRVTWLYDRGSSNLYLDYETLNLMFPGLGISIDPGDGNGARPYTVTGVYPFLGYVTVLYAGNATGNSGGNSVGLQGASQRIYSCSSSSCSIGQAPFSFRAY